MTNHILSKPTYTLSQDLTVQILSYIEKRSTIFKTKQLLRLYKQLVLEIEQSQGHALDIQPKEK